MSGALIEARAVSYGTPDGRVLQEGLSFAVTSGQMLLISGSNGCGKSTLLRALLGQTSVAEGHLRCGVPAGRIQYLPQLENTEIHFPLTLRDVLTISLDRRVEWEDVRPFGLLREAQLDHAWNTASGGERKRTLLTRALLRDPSLLVFDEPMNHLDTESRRSMVRVMAEYLSGDRRDRAIVMVCHQGLEDDESRQFDLVPLNLNNRRVVS